MLTLCTQVFKEEQNGKEIKVENEESKNKLYDFLIYVLEFFKEKKRKRKYAK